MGDVLCIGIDCDENDTYHFCNNPATHVDVCEFNNPVCERHGCPRHRITFEEFERREELKKIPSHWMAL